MYLSKDDSPEASNNTPKARSLIQKPEMRITCTLLAIEVGAADARTMLKENERTVLDVRDASKWGVEVVVRE